MKKIIRNLLLFSVLGWVIACGDDKKYVSHSEGEMTIYCDPANKSLLEALTEIYTMKYPKVEFHIIYKPENKILADLIDTVAHAAFINQPLTEEQSEYLYEKTKVHPRSTLLAYDAAVFIVDKEYPGDSITFDQIRNAILQGDGEIVFDDGNSGNFNTVKKVLDLEIPADLKIQALESTDKVIEYVKRRKNAVGVIGMNEISEEDNPRVREIMQSIKVLKAVDSNGKAQVASAQNILGMNYPFFKGVYFIVREPGFDIGSGFSRFAGSQQGQLIVRREGLQPNFLYPRQVKVNLENVE